jgi:hypothetical protein
MKESVRFVKRTGTNTIVAIHPVFIPEEKTSLRIDIPFPDTGKITDRGAFVRLIFIGYRFGRTVVRAFFTCLAKPFHTK